MNYEELYNKEITSLSSKDLDNHINNIKKFRIEKTDCHGLSAIECSILLTIANTEKINRSNSNLAKVSIVIAIISVLTTLIVSIINK